MSATIWKEALPAQPLHLWFEAFEADAQAALHDLLLGRFDLANLAVTEPRSLLSEWVTKVGNAGDFSSRLDTALTEWIETHWGNVDLAPRAQLLSVWETVAHVLSATYRSGPNAAPLERSAESLRDRLADPSGFPAQLFSPRGPDAFFACLIAAALYQRDDSLRALWWRLAELPDGFPVRYASVALTGIRRLPALSGSFRYDVGIALFTIARALSRRVRDGDCSEQAAAEEIQLLHHQTRRQFPSMEQRWAEVFVQEMKSDRREAYSDAIWQFLDGERGRSPQPQPTRPFSRQNVGDAFRNRQEPVRVSHHGLAITWDPRQPKEIEAAIARREDLVLERADHFLNQQRDYVRKTGLTLNLIQSLHLFASRIRDYDLGQAETWVREELHWEPDNVRSWSLLVDILKRDHPNRAWRMAWAVEDRFPFDPYVHTELAEVLKEQGRLAEAEEVYRQTLDDFPGDIVARTGLADTIRLRVKFNEVPPNPALDKAERLYSQVLALEPDNRFAKNGLERVRRLKITISRTTTGLVADSIPTSDDEASIAERPVPWDRSLDVDDNRTADEPTPMQPASVHRGSRLPRWNATGYHLRLARAAFLRRSARRQAELPLEQRNIAPERLRAGARKLIKEVLLLRPNDSRALTELATLAMDDSTALPELKGDSVAILAVAAQAARMKAKAQGYRRDNSTQRDEVLSPIRRLRSVHPAVTPLVHLQEGLAHLAMLDGEARLNAAAAAFTRLRSWIRPHEAKASVSIFEASRSQRSPVFTAQMWWSHALTKQLFEPSNIDVNGQMILLQADARHLSERLEEVGPIISELELGYARHLGTPVEDLIGEAA